ncbi:MAG: fused MFS/spermidine synthase [Thermodesulfovibrionales bacterium]|nr:fused MFS/spermidine synthase [Thermodesulfovibrionales bacterium]
MTEKNTQRALLLAFCLSGAAALLYEVVWTRALSLILGSTTYALSTMLATFMAGLAIGAYLGGKIADGKKNLIFYFGLLELGIGFFGLITVPLIYSLPPVYFKMYKSFHLSPQLYFIFQFLFSAAIMLVPTTLMGATFPIVSKRLTRQMDEMGRRVAMAYSLNTLGAIFGSLSAGFLLIPAIGIKWSSFSAGCLNILVGGAVILLSREKTAKKIALSFVILLFIAGFFVRGASNEHPFATFYMADRFEDLGHMEDAEKMHVKLMEKDYSEGTVRAYSYNNYLLIQHGGKMEGVGPGDVANTMMLAMLPVAAMEFPQEMLVIGLGAGITVFAGSHLVDKVSVVEINPGVVDVVRKYGIPGTLAGVDIHKDDARRFLAMTDNTYDIITSEPSVPTESVSANLFTREFYEAAASRLNPGGLFCQGLQGWKLTKKDIRVCIKTFASVFDHVYVWKSPDHDNFTLIGSHEPFSFTEKDVFEKMKKWKLIPEGHLETYPVRLILTPDKVRAIAEMPDIPLNTDDKPYLEFAMTRNFIFGRNFKKHR